MTYDMTEDNSGAMALVEVNCSVPHGSVLGPVEFISYVKCGFI